MKVEKRYLRSVRIAFPVFHRNEKRFFNDFKCSVYEYMEQHPQCCLAELEEEFGTPKDVVNSYFENMDVSDYMALMKKSRYLRVVTLVAVVLLFSYFCIRFYMLQQVIADARDTIMVTEKTEIYYDE